MKKTNKLLAIALVLTLILAICSVGASAYYRQLARAKIFSARVETRSSAASLTLMVNGELAVGDGADDFSDSDAVIPMLSQNFIFTDWDEPVMDEHSRPALMAPQMLITSKGAIDDVSLHFDVDGNPTAKELVKFHVSCLYFDSDGNNTGGSEGYVDKDGSFYVGSMDDDEQVCVYTSVYLAEPADGEFFVDGAQGPVYIEAVFDAG